jgi:hypothetical protein
MSSLLALSNWYKERGLLGAPWVAPIAATKQDQPRVVLLAPANLNSNEKQLLEKIQKAATGSVVASDPSECTAVDTVISFGQTSYQGSAYESCSLADLAANTAEKKKLWGFIKGLS